MLKKLHKSSEVEVDAEARTVKGYLSVYNHIDSYGDVVVKGAFDAAIEQVKSGRGVPMLWQHRDPMGMWKTLKSDDTGLFGEGVLSDTQENKDRFTYMTDQVVKGLSIGYDIEHYSVVKADSDSAEGYTGSPPKWCDGEILVLEAVKLYEGSPVTFAANELAEITDVKGALQRARTGAPLTHKDLAMLREFADVLKHYEVTPTPEPMPDPELDLKALCNKLEAAIRGFQL